MRTGQLPHRGVRATQTSAPSSITATENRTARSWSAGASASTSARSVARAGSASARPCTSRATTRRTLVSTTGWRWPYPKQATARAV
ncbi:hypothetical protein ACFQX8_17305 [Klenkia terrae]|uniref:hypothetical protein n=1 Tax=Klenkia terrae TaxID=1052259 RepID=UPI00361C8B14